MWEKVVSAKGSSRAWAASPSHLKVVSAMPTLEHSDMMKLLPHM